MCCKIVVGVKANYAPGVGGPPSCIPFPVVVDAASVRLHVCRVGWVLGCVGAVSGVGGVGGHVERTASGHCKKKCLSILFKDTWSVV